MNIDFYYTGLDPSFRYVLNNYLEYFAALRTMPKCYFRVVLPDLLSECAWIDLSVDKLPSWRYMPDYCIIPTETANMSPSHGRAYFVTPRQINPELIRFDLIPDPFGTAGFSSPLATQPQISGRLIRVPDLPEPVAENRDIVAAPEGIPVIGESAGIINNRTDTDACIMAAVTMRFKGSFFDSSNYTRRALILIPKTADSANVKCTSLAEIRNALNMLYYTIESGVGFHIGTTDGDDWYIDTIDNVWVVPYNAIQSAYKTTWSNVVSGGTGGVFIIMLDRDHRETYWETIPKYNPAYSVKYGTATEGVILPQYNRTYRMLTVFNFYSFSGTFSVSIRYENQNIDITNGLLIASDVSANTQTTARDKTADILRVAGSAAGIAAGAASANPLMLGVAVGNLGVTTANAVANAAGSQRVGGTASKAVEDIAMRFNADNNAWELAPLVCGQKYRNLNVVALADSLKTRGYAAIGGGLPIVGESIFAGSGPIQFSDAIVSGYYLTMADRDTIRNVFERGVVVLSYSEYMQMVGLS